MAGKIFISYRRSETAWAARALFERLARTFPDRVFIDVESIGYGRDFTQEIDRHLSDCEVMLAVIGPTWFEELNDRLEAGESDFVRLELSRALVRGIPVVPVLLDGAKMPRPRDLPDDLKAVSVRNAMGLVADDGFDSKLAQLVRQIGPMLTRAAPVVVTPAVTSPPVTVRNRPSWMHDEGTDQYGRWCEFKVGNVVQRMRWIEPGTFWMGSPSNEPERQENELRHRVVLTKGYWLADTACTQALWEEVVGANPSKFQGDLQLPVEQVSWNDITTVFLPKLNDQVPGLNLELPTEAQWEYACRAGTTTPFSFGEQITPEQVNYNGNYPYNGSKKGTYREKTVPVKALPANGWGLYQMHGNVWEWCADGFGDYPPGEAKDPVCPQDNSTQRVFRGGNWLQGGKFCRSARRNANALVTQDYRIGFRMVRGLADQ
ncbi:SUMF1/EgtB/PvdO family nonheme iron enzyme [Sphaerotilus sp.]|uniref:SUMF1/EgtB/PvdO family nonheme iron enzyme n=1 Tax=Sphaerotilus sp. TaxID=2093942 RepID=UPI002ACD585D|nr:SUMF1/EgtB/PvdO family nonheme iron enzyme [Sphaerotilus sp.]MDZ7856720.1 SUMF1/EgtB/PvdO family nonheme iron enzyme [Sphaerotilus sp.]